MTTYSSVAAGAAASQRAAQCHARLAELRARKPITRADVDRASESLSVARSRALRAYLKVLGVRDTVRVEPVEELAHLRASTSRIGIDTIYFECLQLGAACTAFDLDAFVHEIGALPPADLRILAQVVWEREVLSG